jgi:D-alanine-D-alanine ligase
MKEKIGILFGGESVEHDISIITALQVMKFLPQEYDFLPIYIDKSGVWWTAENLSNIKVYENFKKFALGKRQLSLQLGSDVLLTKKKNKFVPLCSLSAVLNCCHGREGEDGCVQGVFKCCDIAQSSCGVTSSALCMDKAFMKDVLKANDIPSPKYVVLHKCEYEAAKQKTLALIGKKVGYPLIVKPANLGSSIGISVCHSEAELQDATILAFEFDEKIVVESVVQNLKEFNCACFAFRGDFFTSSVSEVENKTNIFTFEDKYISGQPSSKNADGRLARKVKKLTETVYRLFDCNGIVRVDFLYDDIAKILYVNEINAIPGSLAFYLFKDLPFKELLRAVIEESFSNTDKQRRLVKTFDSDALSIFEKNKVEPKK